MHFRWCLIIGVARGESCPSLRQFWIHYCEDIRLTNPVWYWPGSRLGGLIDTILAQTSSSLVLRLVNCLFSGSLVVYGTAHGTSSSWSPVRNVGCTCVVGQAALLAAGLQTWPFVTATLEECGCLSPFPAQVVVVLAALLHRWTIGAIVFLCKTSKQKKFLYNFIM